jgi:hypothetical protein
MALTACSHLYIYDYIVSYFSDDASEIELKHCCHSKISQEILPGQDIRQPGQRVGYASSNPT